MDCIDKKEGQEINSILLEIEELQLKIFSFTRNIILDRSKNSSRLYELLIVVIDTILKDPSTSIINFQNLLDTYIIARISDNETLSEKIFGDETIESTVH